MSDSNNSPKPELIISTGSNGVPVLELAGTDEFALVTTPTSADLAKKEESQLSAEELAVVKEFAKKIDITNSTQVLQYGATSQEKMSQFSENALASVRAKDMDEIGKMVTGLVVELKGFTAAEESKGIFGGIFKKAGKKMTEVIARYDTVEKNVNKISDVLDTHKVTLLKDIAMLDKMYERNLAYFKELSMYILAGRQKLQEVYSTDLPALQTKARESGLMEDAQAANSLAEMCNRFDKKLHDLDLTRTISLQMAPQIRLVQNNNSIMVEKIHSSIVNTIPLWKNQMVLTLGLSHSKQALEAQRKVTDTTNALLRKNAEMLQTSTIETAKESERGIVDIETLTQTNQSLISTLDEVMRIQVEGRQKRREAEVELTRIEGELKNKLLEMRN